MRTAGPIALTGADRLRRTLIAGIVGIMVGATSAFVRPRISGPIHYEAIISLFVVLPAICLWMALSQRGIAWRRAVAWLLLETFTLHLCYAVGWSLVYRDLRAHMFQVLILLWLPASSGSVVALRTWQSFHRSPTGPYCPGCGYCLIGVLVDRCPECGREFTLEELGVTRKELRATDVPGNEHRASERDRSGEM